MTERWIILLGWMAFLGASVFFVEKANVFANQGLWASLAGFIILTGATLLSDRR